MIDKEKDNCNDAIKGLDWADITTSTIPSTITARNNPAKPAIKVRQGSHS